MAIISKGRIISRMDHRLVGVFQVKYIVGQALILGGQI